MVAHRVTGLWGYTNTDQATVTIPQGGGAAEGQPRLRQLTHPPTLTSENLCSGKKNKFINGVRNWTSILGNPPPPPLRPAWSKDAVYLGVVEGHWRRRRRR